jgi:regulator of Ty1 transposition protein 109
MTHIAGELEAVLPSLTKPFTLVHLKTDPTKCRKLIYQPKAKKNAKSSFDMVTSHLLILSYDDLAVYGLEVFVYDSKDCWTLFISKADTSGHYYEDRHKYPLSIKKLTTAILRGLIKHHIPFNTSRKPLRVCLFGKSHMQYLFPLSSENKLKNILTDRALIKWWIETLEPLVDVFHQDRVKATLQIPGSDVLSIKSFFPKQQLFSWQVGDIFNNELPAVKCIPRFPDDPKSRFLDYLVVEHRALKVSKEQFFLELQSRQEFRLGSIVGIIGLEGFVKENGISCAPQSSTHGMMSRRYNTLHDCLLSLDFSKIQSAREGTHSFLSRVGAHSKSIINGKRPAVTADMKRNDAPEATINVLSTSIIRKKPKIH